VNELAFSALSAANAARCDEAFHSVQAWSPTDWACCVAGEVGEACNLVKKLKRGDPVSIEDIGRELADAVIYIDLLAARLGLNLGEEVRRKFNEVSDRIGSSRKL
jgi:NTP pyrophosphatase (non-canonical NTP hydrolase)